MTLKIISTTEILFEGEVSIVTLPGAKGRFTVLHNHAALVSTLVPGNIVFRNNSGEGTTYTISGGIADIDNNIISVCIY